LHALAKAGAKKNESIMSGDNYEADIEGANLAGLEAIWFNPNREQLTSTLNFKTIFHLLEIEELL
jgi:putative hydrolase of the HAD superfamily